MKAAEEILLLVTSFHDAVLRKAQKMIDILMRTRDGQTEERMPWKREPKRTNHPGKKGLQRKNGVEGLWVGWNV